VYPKRSGGKKAGVSNSDETFGSPIVEFWESRKQSLESRLKTRETMFGRRGYSLGDED